uniref:Uncharacterized protein n=1 Tax=Arundo donax TaxID=35708 RepID=A0A0A9F6N7_ARUDO
MRRDLKFLSGYTARVAAVAIGSWSIHFVFIRSLVTLQILLGI